MINSQMTHLLFYHTNTKKFLLSEHSENFRLNQSKDQIETSNKGRFQNLKSRSENLMCILTI